MCEVCNGESGGTEVGVAAISGVPCSISWCDNCLKNDAFPSWVFDHDFVFVAHGDTNNLNEWARQRVTWSDGKYIGFMEYVKRITPEEVSRQKKEYEEEMKKYDN
jgi:hypothetical protein